MRVLFEFRHFFDSESSSTYFKDSCIYVFAKNFDRRDVLERLYYIINSICADGEQAKNVLFF